MEKKINSMIYSIVSVLFLILILTTFSQVLTRYIFNFPLSWAEELSRSLFIWVIFVGIGLLVRSNSHIAVDFFEDRLSLKSAKYLSILTNIFVLVFCLILIFYGTTTTLSQAGQTTSIMDISRSYTYVAIPIGGLLGVIYSVLNIRDEMKGEVE